MLCPVEVRAREPYKIWLRYSDGISGEIDLSDMAGKGVFKAWDTPGFFEKVYIAPHLAIAWSDEIELCPESLYLELTGKNWGDLPEWFDVEVDLERGVA